MKNLVLKAFRGLPCELEEFLIDGITADLEDFGNSDDEREDVDLSTIMPDILRYGCCNRVWRRDLDRKTLAMDKYNLTEKDWNNICDKLEAKLSVGKCGWCV